MPYFFLSGIESRELFLTMWTFMVVAFIDGNFLTFFPFIKRFETIRAEVFIGLAKADMKLKNIATNFAF